MSSADNLCKQFGPRSDRPDKMSGLIWIQTVHTDGMYLLLKSWIWKISAEDRAKLKPNFWGPKRDDEMPQNAGLHPGFCC